MKTLSIKQPWAWLILHAGKDVENRTWPTKVRGRILIHASSTMTRGDYEACAMFCSSLPGPTFKPDFQFPEFGDLKKLCGGIVGKVDVTQCVADSQSPWFCGEFGFVLANPEPTEFLPCKGRLGFFDVSIDDLKNSA